MGRNTFHQIKFLKAPSSMAQNISNDGEFTVSLGNLFQCLTTLLVLLCQLLSFHRWSSLKEKKVSSLYYSHLNIERPKLGLPLLFLCSMLNNPKPLNLSSQECYFILLIIFTSLLWVHFNKSMVLCLGCPKVGCNTQGGISPEQSIGKEFPPSASCRSSFCE